MSECLFGFGPLDQRLLVDIGCRCGNLKAQQDAAVNAVARCREWSKMKIAMPLFILMGNFATQGGISRALFEFASGVMSRGNVG